MSGVLDSGHRDGQQFTTGQSHDRANPPDPDHRPGPDRHFSAKNNVAPAHRLALGNRFRHAIHPCLRSTSNGLNP